MPWCPVCKNEYREGIEFCAECKVPLVESLEKETYQPFIFGEEEKMIRLQEFLNYGDSKIATKLTRDEEENVYRLSVLDRDRKSAVKAAQIFLMQEAEEQEPKEIEEVDVEDDNDQRTGSYHYYQNSAARAEDNKSSAYTLLVVGGIGFIAVLLIFFNVTPLYRNGGITKYMVCGIMGAMFILFIIFGILSMRNSKVLFSKAKTENSLLVEMTRWCEDNLSAEELDQGLFQEEMPEEQKYFKRADKMKAMINDKFMNLDEAFVEHFVDEYYQKLYEGR